MQALTDETATILWRWADRPGHDAARVTRTDDGLHRIEGVAAFAADGEPVMLRYEVNCDAAWVTRSAHVSGAVGSRDIAIDIVRRDDGVWLLNGVEQPQVAGCIDVDLNFSPSTNLLPVRRLALAVGDSAPVRAAWLRFPSFALEVLEQTYSRTGDEVYEYESGGGAFRAAIRVNRRGLARDYAGVWTADAES
jgi:hypothetical protein